MNKTKTAFTLREGILLLASTMIILTGSAVVPVLPRILEVFKETPHAPFLTRMILSLPALSIAIASPLVGLILDRWGRKPVLLVSLGLYGLFGASVYLLDSLFAILISRILLGLAISGIVNSCITLIADYFSGTSRHRFMGLQSAVMGYSGVIYITVAGLLGDIHWRLPFLIYLLSLLILPVALFSITEPEHIMKSKGGDQDESRPREPLPVKQIAFIYFISFFGMILFYMVPVQLPFYLKSLGVTSKTMIGSTMALMTLFSATMATQYHKVKERLSFNLIFVILFSFMGVGYIIIASSTNYLHVMIAMAISGLGLGLFIPSMNVYTVSIIPERVRGRIVGGMSTAFFLGQFFSPIIVYPSVETIGLAGSFAVASGLMLTFAIILFIVNYRNTRRHPL